MYHYDRKAMDRLYALVWGESIQFGFYDTGNEDIDTSTENVKAKLSQPLKINRKTRILEVGSGYGTTARYLANCYHANVIASNYSLLQTQIALGKTIQSGMENHVKHCLADFHNLPFSDDSFDVHWSQECLVHSVEKTRFFSEAIRVLRPGGLITFSDQTTDTGRCQAEEKDIIAKRHGSGDLCGISEFEALMNAAGFETLRVDDWSSHLTRHFERLVERIDERRELIAREVDQDTLEFNYWLWDWAAKRSREGKIGWARYIGRKPGG